MICNAAIMSATFHGMTDISFYLVLVSGTMTIHLWPALPVWNPRLVGTQVWMGSYFFSVPTVWREKTTQNMLLFLAYILQSSKRVFNHPRKPGLDTGFNAHTQPSIKLDQLAAERCKLRHMWRWARIPGWWALAHWGAQVPAEGNTE